MSQIVTKFITDNAVTDLKARLRNNQFLRGRNAADSADINIAKVNASDIPELNSLTEISGTPTTANQVTNKGYVDGLVGAGVSKMLQSVRAATLGNITLSGTQTIDSIALSAGNRCLVRAQTTASENGIYDVSAGAWTRSSDAISAGSLVPGSSVYVFDGVQYGRKMFTVDVLPGTSITIGTTSMPWRQVNFVSKYETLTLNGTDITNQYKDLTVQLTVSEDSLLLWVDGVMQSNGPDYSLSTVANKTRITFNGDLATGGAAELVAGDVLRVVYNF